MSDCIFLYVPIDTMENAEKIATSLISNDHAACINVIPGGLTIYKWQGKTEKSAEQFMLVKVLKAKAAKARELILSMHPYEVPCVAEVNIESLNAAYLNWLKEAC